MARIRAVLDLELRQGPSSARYQLLHRQMRRSSVSNSARAPGDPVFGGSDTSRRRRFSGSMGDANTVRGSRQGSLRTAVSLQLTDQTDSVARERWSETFWQADPSAANSSGVSWSTRCVRTLST